MTNPWDQLSAAHKIQRELAKAREVLTTARDRIDRNPNAAERAIQLELWIAVASLERAASAAIEAAVKRNLDV